MKTVYIDDAEYTINDGVVGFKNRTYPALLITKKVKIKCAHCSSKPVRKTVCCFYDNDHLGEVFPELNEFSDYFDQTIDEYNELFEQTDRFAVFNDKINFKPNLMSIQFFKAVPINQWK